MTRRSLTVGTDRFVVGPWHDEPSVAYVSLAPSHSVLTNRASVERCVEQLRQEGFRGAVTAALRTNDAYVFHSAGFEVKERLHVLRHDLTAIPEVSPATARHLRRARRRDRPAVLGVDRLAFDPFWTLGPDGLDEALGATASVRFRVFDDPGRREHHDGSDPGHVAGYAVCGRAADIGYLQRLAVHPDHLRQGIGTALVADSLRWLVRRRCRVMLVNTQESNGSALALYQHLGFRLESEHLTVLSWAAP